VLLGAPSLSGFLYFLWAALELRLASPSGDLGGKQDYNSLVGLLVAGASAAGKALSWFTNSAQWVIALMAACSMILLLAAVALFSIGRGLQTHQMWARILGMMLASGVFVAGAFCALMFRRSPVVAATSGVAAVSSYVFWALWRQFV
jgi:hypothetical protein